MHSTCMTTAAVCHRDRSLQPRAEPLSDRLSRGLTRITGLWRTWQRHRQAMAALSAMPLDLRKDLGWPACDTRGEM